MFTKKGVYTLLTLAMLLFSADVWAMGWERNWGRNWDRNERNWQQNFAGSGICNGTPQTNLTGEEVTISGVVADLPAPGNPGLKIYTGEGIVTVYGLGPWWLWEKMGIVYPTVGETIEVAGYKVFLGDSERIIAKEVTVSGQTITLRDENRHPIWRSEQGMGNNNHNDMDEDVDNHTQDNYGMHGYDNHQ